MRRTPRGHGCSPSATEARAGIVGSEVERHVVAQTPLGRFGRPADIAPVAVFLASDDSAWLTGEVLVASGGYR